MMANEMLHIETCAKQDGRFVPIETVSELKLRSPLYVDGSIRVTVWGRPLITDAEWTDIVEWWGSMSNVLKTLSHGSESVAEAYFSWPGTMLFEVSGETLTWTLRGAQTRAVTLDRVPALRILMREYRRFFERMQIISPRSNGDYDVALDYMSNSCRGRSASSGGGVVLLIDGRARHAQRCPT